MEKNTKDRNALKSNPSRSIQTLLTLLIIISAMILVLELAVPVKLNDNQNVYVANRIAADSNTPEIMLTENSEPQLVNQNINYRPGLFKPVKTIDRTMADRNIQNILSKLDLQVIMDLSGRPVAYVKVKGEGTKRCFVGDNVEGLFTVINISEENIRIKILEHEVILYL